MVMALQSTWNLALRTTQEPHTSIHGQEEKEEEPTTTRSGVFMA